MPAITLAICGVPVIISARSLRFIRLFADYFRYYAPQIISSEKGSTNFSLSKFPNACAIEANDKLKFVEPRAARFSLFQGVVANDSSSFDDEVVGVFIRALGNRLNAVRERKVRAEAEETER